MLTGQRAPTDIAETLQSMGFRRLRQPSRFRRSDLLVEINGGWCTLSRRATKEDDPLENQIGRPGLWRVAPRVRKRGGRQMYSFEFDVPLSALAAEPVELEDGMAADPIIPVFDWAQATFAADSTVDAVLPSRAEIESMLDPEASAVQTGPFVRQVTLCRDRGRLALRCPILQRWPESPLPESRRDWLRHVLLAAQRRWRMVRVGFGAEETAAVVAEIDLTGAPPGALEALFQSGRDALRCVVAWLVWPVGFLCEPGVGCNAWDVSPVRD